MINRYGEPSKAWFRSERFYHTDDGWWFQTREQIELGPFESQPDAKAEVCLYLRELYLKQDGLFHVR